MAHTYQRWQVAWKYHDIDGRVTSKHREFYTEGAARQDLERYRGKNDYLMGGAFISDIKLYRIDVTETWTQIEGETP